MLELISLHVPKCAGDSLLKSLREIYGSDLFADYERDKLLTPLSEFNMDPDGYMERLPFRSLGGIENYRCVHGHFYIRKFDTIKNAKRITMLREPVERMISHYLFTLWRTKEKVGPIQKYVLDNNLNILEFSRLPAYRYIYTRHFFRNVDMSMFDIIGDYADMPSWQDRLGHLLGRPIYMQVSNAEPAKVYSKLRQEILDDQATLAKIRDILREDIDFYEHHCH